jgi:hypothetical protein
MLIAGVSLIPRIFLADRVARERLAALPRALKGRVHTQRRDNDRKPLPSHLLCLGIAIIKYRKQSLDNVDAHSMLVAQFRAGKLNHSLRPL